MGKGILLEVEGRRGVVLTPQGEFKRVPIPQGSWDIGDEVDFAETAVARPARGTRWGIVAVAAVLMLLLSPFGYRYWELGQAVAFVTIDINPSVRLTLNVEDTVIKAEGLNADGELVLQGVDWSKKPVDEVVASVTARAVAVGKLDPADESSAVVVAVAPANAKDLPQEHADELAVKSRTAVSTTVEEKAKVQNVEVKTNLAVVEVTAREAQEAKEHNATPGQWVFIKKIQEKLPDVKLPEPKDFRPGKTIRENGLPLGLIFGEVEETHGPKSAPKAKDDEGKGGEKDADRSTPASGNRKDGEKDRNEDGDRRPGNGNQPGNGGNGNGGNGNNGRDDDDDQPGRGNSGRDDDDDRPGRGNSGRDDDDDRPGNGNNRSNQEDDKSGTGTGKPGNDDDRKPPGQVRPGPGVGLPLPVPGNGQSGRPGGQGPNRDDDKKSNGESDGGKSKENDSDKEKKNVPEPKKDEPKKNQGEDKKSSDSWKVPFFDIEIPKPPFLRGGDPDPRAPAPGAGSSQPEQPKVDEPKPAGPEPARPEPARPEPARPEPDKPQLPLPGRGNDHREENRGKPDNGGGNPSGRPDSKDDGEDKKGDNGAGKKGDKGNNGEGDKGERDKGENGRSRENRGKKDD